MLVEAGLACLARGGLPEFTVDRICREAGASRGLITHHFGSVDELLAAVYATLYDRILGIAAPLSGEEPDLRAIVEAVLSDDMTDPATLRAWLALWGEVAARPALQAAHRRYYDHYEARVTAAIRRQAAGQPLRLPAESLAILLISLVDGLWLERCIDPSRVSGPTARHLCLDLLDRYLGPPDPERPLPGPRGPSGKDARGKAGP